jgi:Carboxypeptidase regulatory-like domain
VKKRLIDISVVLCCVILLTGGTLWGQGIFATLTGVVSDPSGAVVANAKVVLKDAASGSLRDTTTNGDGYFTFASVPVGTYNLSVVAPGFSTYKAEGIALGGAEKRNLNVSLAIGAASQTVEVNAQEAPLVTTDSGEKSFTLESKDLQNLTQVGSDAAEYIKIMPGFGIQNGTSNKANYTGEVIGINANGDGGSQSPLNNAYTYNGLPSNSLDITADGAHVSDPGCNCDTPVNPNSDFVQEFKILTSNFGAENQKGPILITSVTKSGGQQFHGSGFFSARNFVLNANDALNNADGAPKPENKYYYPGGSIGGPVILPGTGFNKSRTKLFFFTGFEYFYQVLDTGLLRATVPTTGPTGMTSGNFSTSELEKLGDPTHNYNTASGNPMGSACPNTAVKPTGTETPYLPCLNAAGLAVFGGTPDGNGGYNVQIPTGDLNANMLALMKLYPAPNADPSQTGGYNYVQSEIFNQNNVQWTSRVDYNISDNTKLFVRYNLQRETQLFPVGLWWRNGAQVPYPSSVEGKNSSDSVSASLTHVFNPTMTNEFVFGYTLVKFPNIFSNPSAVDRTKVGYDVQGLFKNGIAQIPSFGSFGNETALIFNPGGFEAGGATQGLYANKYMPSISDTVTKVVGTHTLKVGFYWEWIRNAQPANNDSNGQLQFQSSNNTLFTTGDSYADEVLGLASHYDETTFNRINDIAYNTYEGFVQDDWKATKRLTINFGLRFSHFQPWNDRLGDGYSIFDQTQYAPDCTGAPTFCGFEWHKKDASVPLGGFPTRALFYMPRFGAAYDLRGNGKTVLRGGWGRFYFHTGQFTNGLDASAGVQSIGFDGKIPVAEGGNQPILVNPLTSDLTSAAPWNTATGNAGLDTLNFSAVAAGPSAVDSKDNKQPHTDSYSFTISQRLPWSSMLEVSYVGNRTEDIASSGNGGSLGFNTLNINPVPVGAMLASANGGVNPATLNANDFRPMTGYSDLYLTTNNGRANYNGLQAVWVRAKGRYNLQLNYTFSKALGIVGFYNQFNVNDNYGVLPNNRTHLFNATYSVELGNPLHSNAFVNGAVNGWQLSGITQIESGPNLTGLQGQNFGMNYNGAIFPGSVSTLNPDGIAYNNVSLLGTPDIQLNPILTCNPTSNLGPHQWINGNCFSAPTTIGQNGPTTLPAIYGPAFFSSDLALFKSFKITESKNLQFRVSAYNFLNHPLWSFNGNNLGLSYTQDATTGALTQSNSTFGEATNKQGHRIVELALKFYF